MELDQGKGDRLNTRFYYDTELRSCEQFIFGGSGGNLNNFVSILDCQQFCMQPINLSDDDAHFHMDLYSVGFALTGPLTREKHTQTFNKFV